MCFRNMSWKKGVFFIFLVGLLAESCVSDNSNVIPDVSDIYVDVKIRRFEEDLFKIDTNNIQAELQVLEEKYPEFGQIFFENILRSKDSLTAPQGHEAFVKGFIYHPALQFLRDTCQVLFPSLEPFEEEFASAFQFYKYYYPNDSVPDITTFISEYTIGAFIYGDNSLACGLDFFLGENYPYATYNPQNPNFSAYLTRSFNKDHLVSKTLQPLVEDKAGAPRGTRMLDMMINNGKKLYLLDRLLPHHPDSVIMEVTGAQIEWLEDNELEMWAYFLKEDLLYSSEWQSIRKFVEYSPHSPGMPPEAPGRTANWVGWQIVKAYMRRFPDTTMDKLMAITDAQKIMDGSRYKPGR